MTEIVTTLSTAIDLRNRWLLARNLAHGTIHRYKSAIESFLCWYEKEEPRLLNLDLLTPIKLVGYRNFLQRTQARETITLNRHISALRSWCTELTEYRYLMVNPAKRIKLGGRQEVTLREGMSDIQVNALLRQVQSSSGDATRNYAIIQLLLQTGMRLDECSHLNLEDIEFGEQSGRVTIQYGKGYKACTVPLNASAWQALANYLAPGFGCDPTEKAIAQAWPRSRSSAKPIPLWYSQKGGVLMTSAMRQMVGIVVRDTAARGLVPANASSHILLHTWARNYLAEYPGDVIGLSTLFEHTSLDTARMYSQPSVEQLSIRIKHLKQNAYSD